VAKHRQGKNRPVSSASMTTQKRRRSPSVLLLSATAAAVSTVLVFGHATNNTVDSSQLQLAAATIGIGGRGDPNATKVPNKLNRHVVPFGDTFPHYIPVSYPAGFDIDNSVAAGVPVLDQTIRDNSNQSCGDPAVTCPFLLVVGYSEGALVAEKVRRGLDPSQPDAPPKGGLLFVMIASPNVPNGGIFSRLPGLKIPFFVTSNGAAQPSPYDTTYVTNEYDPYADFPAYFNPLSLLNSLFALAYVHPDQYYDSVDYDPRNPDSGTTRVLVKTVPDNGAGGTDTYVFVPAAHLPLFAPARQIFGVLGLTPLTEPVLSAIEPVLRLLVDMGYTDRQNLNPEVPVKFSLITPPARIIETIAQVPGALGQGVNNLTTGGGSLPTSIPAPVAPTIAPTNSPSINARTLPQEPQESLMNTDPPSAGTTDPAPPQTPSGSGTPQTPSGSGTPQTPSGSGTPQTPSGSGTPQTPSGSGTSPTQAPVSPLSNSGPTLGEVTEDGSKATPNTTSSKTTSPKKNVFTRLADTFKGFLTPKKAPASTTPKSEPNDPTPSGSTSQGQSEGPTSNAA
jgi:diacyltrehalose acyltransferase